jgi:hypothetical protein
MVQGFTKVSICLFYLRIFPQRWFQTATICTIVFISTSCTVFIFVIAFQCHPASSFWDRTKHGICIDQSAMGYTGAAASILQHIIILLLPIPCISSLQLGRGKKISLFVMFGLGSFALGTSLVRVRFIVGFGATTDITCKHFKFLIFNHLTFSILGDYSNIEIWSVIELAVAFICACLPALRPLLLRYVPSLFSSVKSKHGTPSRPRNGSKSNGGITVSSTFRISRSMARSGHIELEDGESRSDNGYAEERNIARNMNTVVSGGEEPSPKTWSVDNEVLELVSMRQGDDRFR